MNKVPIPQLTKQEGMSTQVLREGLTDEVAAFSRDVGVPAPTEPDMIVDDEAILSGEPDVAWVTPQYARNQVNDAGQVLLKPRLE